MHHERLVIDIMPSTTEERPAPPSKNPRTERMMAIEVEPNIPNCNGDRRPSIPASTTRGPSASIEELAHLHGAAAAQARGPDATSIDGRLTRATKHASLAQATGDIDGTSTARGADPRRAAPNEMAETTIMMMVQPFWPSPLPR